MTLSIDEQLVSQGDTSEGIEPFYGAAALSIGKQRVTQISPRLPPAFTGIIHSVDVHLVSA